MEQWLIRTADHHLSGPLSKEEVKSKLLTGELKADDEICPANSYWFSVHEVQEVRNHFGIDPPISALPLRGADDDVTATQIVVPSAAASAALSDEGQTTFLNTGATHKKPTVPSGSQHEFGSTSGGGGAAPQTQNGSPGTPQISVASSRQENPKSLFFKRLDGLLHWEGLRWVVTGATILLVYGILRLWMN